MGRPNIYNLNDLRTTKQGAKGIDLFRQDKRFGFDLTTKKAWPKHVRKYKKEYGIILPLLYK